MVAYPEHLRGFDYTGPYRYFLTFCTHERQPHFLQAQCVELVRDQILRTAARDAFALLAYCFMPDHVHLLAYGLSDDAMLKPFIKSAKQHSAWHFSRRVGKRLWQRYGYEHVLRSDEGTFQVARYTIENPIRAGLVSDTAEYPFWGSSLYSREQLLE